MKGKLLLHLFLVLLPVIIEFALMLYPYIVNANVKIVSAEIVDDDGKKCCLKLHLKGTITIDPTKIPKEAREWYNSPSFLEWWEKPENINKVIKKESKHWTKIIDLQIEVKSISLRWIKKDKGKFDVIGFDVIVNVYL